MSDLTTVPTLTFRQGKHSDSTFEENPIQISYYNNCIELRQEGAFTQDETVLISPKHLNALFKAIKNNLPEAQKFLNKTP